MGDRCYLEVCMRREDYEKFMAALRYDPDHESEEDDAHSIRLVFQDANYGMTFELDAAAAAGCLFYGFNTSGDNYGPRDFYSKDNECCHIATAANGDGYAVWGATPEQRLECLKDVEQRIAERQSIMQRIHNPLYDLITEGNDNG